MSRAPSAAVGSSAVGSAAVGPTAVASSTAGPPPARISARDLARSIGLPPPTEEQAAVVEAPMAPAVVIAGAGSGKTETMATRVVWLVANRMVEADGVLGLTFTRKAAAELGERIRRHLRRWAAHAGTEERARLAVAEPSVQTYAAYSGRLVADHALRLGEEPTTRLISPASAWQLADAAVRHYSADLPEDIGTPASVTVYVQRLAAEMADHLQDPAAVLEFTDRVMAFLDRLPMGNGARSDYPGQLKDFVTTLQHRRQILPLVEDFTRAKVGVGAVDFADQMVWAARLAALPEVRKLERARYPAVLLDEYQDTGHAQVALLHGLFGDGHAVTAVGDPFQSIYGWRGASAGNIARFSATFAREGTSAAAFVLSTSWRNDRAVLTSANRVAAPLRRAHPGTTTLVARPDAPAGDVAAAFLVTAEEEARWVAGELAERWGAAARVEPDRERTAAVLVRRRSQMAVLEEALRAAGLPVEIVGLGGLLTTPEVSDVVATLHVLADYASGPALLRLLTGARWRIGPRDLLMLARRARQLANPDDPRGREPGSIVEALDDLGPPERYSATGYARLGRLAAELHGLRRRLAAPLPDLVAEVERALGVDVEVSARPDRRHVGRVHLDRFLAAAAEFAADADEATLGAFLAFLTAAEDEENGLEAGEVEVGTERIQLLTVHGAKGLEWDLVAVPGMVDGVFPSLARGNDWTRARHLLPFPLRGDAPDLPQLDLFAATSRRELAGWIKASARTDPPDDHNSRMKERHEREERRLAYVASTRARRSLIVSGYCWDTSKAPRTASALLQDLADAATLGPWHVAADGELNPNDALDVVARWPFDPLGARRSAVEAGAQLVRAAVAEADDPLPITARLTAAESELVTAWEGDTTTLLAERAAQREDAPRTVELPARLSVSQLVALRADPDELARRLRRPLPARPAPLARRGTAFHLWLEQRWGGDKLLDLDELPGAGDESAVEDADLTALREAFLASEWATRAPHEVEVPFEMVVEGIVVRGRMDAVFADGSSPDGSRRWLVVDWKTGAVPSGRHADEAAVQLAAYRLAWADISGAHLAHVAAAFHYVPANSTVRPADLLDAEALRRLVRLG
ncbi:MAG: ATP-dependent DNA helicase [bacterium]